MEPALPALESSRARARSSACSALLVDVGSGGERADAPLVVPDPFAAALPDDEALLLLAAAEEARLLVVLELCRSAAVLCAVWW